MQELICQVNRAEQVSWSKIQFCARTIIANCTDCATINQRQWFVCVRLVQHIFNDSWPMLMSLALSANIYRYCWTVVDRSKSWVNAINWPISSSSPSSSAFLLCRSCFLSFSQEGENLNFKRIRVSLKSTRTVLNETIWCGTKRGSIRKHFRSWCNISASWRHLQLTRRSRLHSVTDDEHCCHRCTEFIHWPIRAHCPPTPHTVSSPNRALIIYRGEQSL